MHGEATGRNTDTNDVRASAGGDAHAHQPAGLQHHEQRATTARRRQGPGPGPAHRTQRGLAAQPGGSPAGAEDNWSNGWRMVVEQDGLQLLYEQRLERASIVGNQPVARQVRFSGLGVPLHAGERFRPGRCSFASAPSPSASTGWYWHTQAGSACAKSPASSRCARPAGQISERTRNSLGIEKVMFSSRPSSSSAPVAPQARSCSITPRTSTSGPKHRR